MMKKNKFIFSIVFNLLFLLSCQKDAHREIHFIGSNYRGMVYIFFPKNISPPANYTYVFPIDSNGVCISSYSVNVGFSPTDSNYNQFYLVDGNVKSRVYELPTNPGQKIDSNKVFVLYRESGAIGKMPYFSYFIGSLKDLALFNKRNSDRAQFDKIYNLYFK